MFINITSIRVLNIQLVKLLKLTMLILKTNLSIKKIRNNAIDERTLFFWLTMFLRTIKREINVIPYVIILSNIDFVKTYVNRLGTKWPFESVKKSLRLGIV